jgi:hypothetical protein
MSVLLLLHRLRCASLWQSLKCFRASACRCPANCLLRSSASIIQAFALKARSLELSRCPLFIQTA